jgi:hypothetical protein
MRQTLKDKINGRHALEIVTLKPFNKTENISINDSDSFDPTSITKSTNPIMIFVNRLPITTSSSLNKVIYLEWMMDLSQFQIKMMKT